MCRSFLSRGRALIWPEAGSSCPGFCRRIRAPCAVNTETTGALGRQPETPWRWLARAAQNQQSKVVGLV